MMCASGRESADPICEPEESVYDFWNGNLCVEKCKLCPQQGNIEVI